MANTILGTFDETYHHIDAPTFEDKGRSEELHQRILNDFPNVLEDYTNPAFYYLQGNEWKATRKIDGTNLRIRWDGEQAVVAGKTNKANLASLGETFADYVETHFPEGRFEEKFGRDKDVVIFGEWVGPKVQKNDLQLAEPELVIFDVKIGNFWLDKRSVGEIAYHFDCHTPHYFMEGEITETLQNLISDVADGNYRDWEGIVAEPAEQLRDRAGKRIICKIKNADYNEGWKQWLKESGNDRF